MRKMEIPLPVQARAGPASPRRIAPRSLTVLTLALLLTACAGARITQKAILSPPPVLPATILVGIAFDAPADPALQQVASRLERKIVEDMVDLGLPARAASARSGSADTRLTLRLVELRKGDPAQRMLIGFGAGKSAMLVTARLSTPDGVSFDLTARATSGSKPGLIMAGGVAAATGKLLHMVIGGSLGLISDVRGGTGGNVRNVSRLVARQVRDYYRSADPA